MDQRLQIDAMVARLDEDSRIDAAARMEAWANTPEMQAMFDKLQEGRTRVMEAAEELLTISI